MGKYITGVVQNWTYEGDFTVFRVPGNQNYWTLRGPFNIMFLQK